MTFIQLKQLLPRAANKWTMQRSISASMICTRYRQYAPEAIHKQILQFSRPRYFKDGVLVVWAQDSVWAQEIFLKKEALKSLINKSLEGNILVDIRTESREI